jgi:hypothetical protein
MGRHYVEDTRWTRFIKETIPISKEFTIEDFISLLQRKESTKEKWKELPYIKILYVYQESPGMVLLHLEEALDAENTPNRIRLKVFYNDGERIYAAYYNHHYQELEYLQIPVHVKCRGNVIT